MSRFPDKYFDLAIVDPPYGINYEGYVKLDDKKWDAKPPDKNYYLELFRSSKNQIIWGGNYFIEYLTNCRCYIVWDKKAVSDKLSFAMSEFAWTSFDSVPKTFYCLQPGNKGFFKLNEQRIHIAQKPVALYKWLLKNYAHPGDKILDTHLGSGSIAIACLDMGFDLWGSELDADYFHAMEKRISEYEKQPMLFEPRELTGEQLCLDI
jgi:site-specific DNA-methyltransferase (adenine-specific)